MRALACGLLVVAACTRAKGPPGRPDFIVLTSADLRGAVLSPPHAAGGLARRATLVDRARLSAPVVQLDAGDLAPSAADDPSLADPAARVARAALALRMYRRLGVDAVTVGERDLALGVSTLRRLFEETKVPVVAANVSDAEGRPLFAGERLLQAGGASVGVFGVLEDAAGTGPPGVVVTDPSAAAQAAVASLRRRGAQVVVGLFHVSGGLARAREIAAATAGVDLIVLGHGAAGGAAIRETEVQAAGRRAPRLEGRQVDVAADLPEQPGVRLLARLATGSVAATFAESVAALSKAGGPRVFGEGWTYGSTALCVGCHPAEAAQWKTTDHARAFATLQGKGHDREPACMGCHVTGFLQPGGPQNLETATTQFGDVGCESCHGPSVAHVLSSNKHQGTTRNVDPLVCLGCHTPDQNVGPFVVSEAMKDVVGPGHGLPARPSP